MSRSWRIEYAGALYHLLSRGNEGVDIFREQKDREIFLEIIGEFSERFDIDVFAYVLMDNHYHLLVQTRDANLKKAMHWFGTTYTQRFNRRHSRSGHLFQGRYKSIIVQNNTYMMRLSCYIHRNPLRAGTVKRLADYRWSSYLSYAYGRKPPEWLLTDLILSQFEKLHRHRQYREKVQRYAKEEKRLLEDLRHGLCLGTKDFVDKICKDYLPSETDPSLPQQKIIAKPADPLKLLQSAQQTLNCDIKRFAQARRLSGTDKDNRDILVYLLWKSGGLSNNDIGMLFGVGVSAVSHVVRSVKMRKDPDFVNKLKQLYSLFKL